MPWQIPKNDVLAILKINGLPDEFVDELGSALAVAPMKHDFEEMTDYIADNFPAIHYGDLASIIRVLDTLYNIMAFADVELHEFIHDIIEGVQYSDYDDIDSQEIEVSILRRKLETLLNIKK